METCTSSSGTHCSMPTVMGWGGQGACLAGNGNLIKISLGAPLADRSRKTAPSSSPPTKVAVFAREYPLHLCLSQRLRNVPPTIPPTWLMVTSSVIFRNWLTAPQLHPLAAHCPIPTLWYLELNQIKSVPTVNKPQTMSLDILLRSSTMPPTPPSFRPTRFPWNAWIPLLLTFYSLSQPQPITAMRWRPLRCNPIASINSRSSSTTAVTPT